MQQKLSIKIILPSKILLELQSDEIIIPGNKGLFSILPYHIKFTSILNIGIITINNIKSKYYFIYGGIAQISNNTVNIITEYATDIKDYNKSIILNKINTLKQNLLLQSKKSIDYKITLHMILIYESLLKFL